MKYIPKVGLILLFAPSIIATTLSRPSFRIFQLESLHCAATLASCPEMSTRGKRDSTASDAEADTATYGEAVGNGRLISVHAI